MSFESVTLVLGIVAAIAAGLTIAERMTRIGRRFVWRRWGSPEFIMREVYAADLDGPLDQAISYPDHLKSLSPTTLFFNLASSSPMPVWVQNVWLVVLNVEPRKEATFPYYGEGAPGPLPIQGYAILKPAPGRYRVELAQKSRLGRGVEPDEFHIRTFCEPGYRYQVGIEVEWTDMDDQRRGGEIRFAESVQLDFPELVEWTDVVGEAQEVRILFYQFAENLVGDLEALEQTPSYRILVAAPGWDWLSIENLEHTSRVADEEIEVIATTVGLTKIMSRQRNFILTDKSLLLLQDDERLDRAQLVTDQDQVAPVEKMFDNLAD